MSQNSLLEWKISRARKSRATGTNSKLTKVSCEQVRACRGKGFRYILPNSLLIEFRNDGLCKLVQWKSLSYVQLFMTPWIIAHQATLSMEFSRRILEWVLIPFSRGSSHPRDQIWVSCIAGRFFTSWDTREAPSIYLPQNPRAGLGVF